MEILDTYLTLKEQSEGIYKEKGSKFIAYALPCYSEEEAKKHLESWRKEHYQARHVCYAYRFGLNKDVFRANDDGEPNNSAGTPILGQIQSFDLTNVLIAVVRYFGGTKLGVGGLVTAYKSAAKDAIEQGTIIECQVYDRYRIEYTYDLMPELMNYLKKTKIDFQTLEMSATGKIELALNLSTSPLTLNEIEEIGDFKIDYLGRY